MDLREKPSFWFRIAELLVRLRWIWILGALMMSFSLISDISRVYLPYSEELRMQHKFTLQFLILNKGGITELLSQIFGLGLPFILPIFGVSMIAAFFKQKIAWIIFPVVFITQWQFFFLNNGLQERYLLMLGAMGALGFLSLFLKQNFGGLILPVSLVGVLGIFWSLRIADVFMLTAIKEYHWNLELMSTLLFTDLLVLGISTVKYLNTGKPKQAALVHSLKELFPIWLLRNLAILVLSGLYITQTHPSFVLPTILSQVFVFIAMLTLSAMVFPAILSILPFKTFKN